MNSPCFVHIVILASGNSTRFGADKRAFTLPSVLKNILAATDAINDITLLCVLKTADQDHLDSLLGDFQHDARINYCWNACPEDGVGQSIVLATKTLLASGLPIDAAMIFLADMPYIHPHTIRQLMALAKEDRIIAPVYQGQRGHPVIFGSDYFTELQQLQGDVGARQVLMQYAANVLLVDVDDKGVIIDIDTPDDWQQAQRDFSV